MKFSSNLCSLLLYCKSWLAVPRMTFRKPQKSIDKESSISQTGQQLCVVAEFSLETSKVNCMIHILQKFFFYAAIHLLSVQNMAYLFMPLNNTWMLLFTLPTKDHYILNSVSITHLMSYCIGFMLQGFGSRGLQRWPL